MLIEQLIINKLIINRIFTNFVAKDSRIICREVLPVIKGQHGKFIIKFISLLKLVRIVLSLTTIGRLNKTSWCCEFSIIFLPHCTSFLSFSLIRHMSYSQVNQVTQRGWLIKYPTISLQDVYKRQVYILLYPSSSSSSSSSFFFHSSSSSPSPGVLSVVIF